MKINIKGPIISSSDQWIYDWFGIDATSPKKILDILEQANGEDIEADINSGGGSVFDASEIYTAIRNYAGKKTGNIVGVAASAASVIASAFDVLRIAPTGQMMIHNASTKARGDYRDMDHTSDFLQKVNQSIINAYAAKTGKTFDELKKMMDAETWMTAQEAKEHGFVDAIMFEQEVGAVANLEHHDLVNGILPQEVIDKMREALAKDKGLLVDNNIQQQTQPEEPNNQGGNQHMDLEKLKNDYPELYEQVKNEGYQEGVKAENDRFKAIDEIATAGFEDLVNKAKYESPVTAEQLAVEMIKAQKQAGANFLSARQEDAAVLNQIEGTAVPQNEQSELEKVDKEAEALANAVNKKRGIK